MSDIDKSKNQQETSDSHIVSKLKDFVENAKKDGHFDIEDIRSDLTKKIQTQENAVDDSDFSILLTHKKEIVNELVDNENNDYENEFIYVLAEAYNKRTIGESDLSKMKIENGGTENKVAILVRNLSLFLTSIKAMSSGSSSGKKWFYASIGEFKDIEKHHMKYALYNKIKQGEIAETNDIKNVFQYLNPEKDTNNELAEKSIENIKEETMNLIKQKLGEDTLKQPNIQEQVEILKSELDTLLKGLEDAGITKSDTVKFMSKLPDLGKLYQEYNDKLQSFGNDAVEKSRALNDEYAQKVQKMQNDFLTSILSDKGLQTIEKNGVTIGRSEQKDKLFSCFYDLFDLYNELTPGTKEKDLNNKQIAVGSLAQRVRDMLAISQSIDVFKNNKADVLAGNFEYRQGKIFFGNEKNEKKEYAINTSLCTDLLLQTIMLDDKNTPLDSKDVVKRIKAWGIEKPAASWLLDDKNFGSSKGGFDKLRIVFFQANFYNEEYCGRLTDKVIDPKTNDVIGQRHILKDEERKCFHGPQELDGIYKYIGSDSEKNEKTKKFLGSIMGQEIIKGLVKYYDQNNYMTVMKKSLLIGKHVSKDGRTLGNNISEILEKETTIYVGVEGIDVSGISDYIIKVYTPLLQKYSKEIQSIPRGERGGVKYKAKKEDSEYLAKKKEVDAKYAKEFTKAFLQYQIASNSLIANSDKLPFQNSFGLTIQPSQFKQEEWDNAIKAGKIDQYLDTLIADDFFSGLSVKFEQMLAQYAMDPVKGSIDLLSMLGAILVTGLVNAGSAGMLSWGSAGVFYGSDKFLRGLGYGTVDYMREGGITGKSPMATWLKGFGQGRGWLDEEYKLGAFTDIAVSEAIGYLNTVAFFKLGKPLESLGGSHAVPRLLVGAEGFNVSGQILDTFGEMIKQGIKGNTGAMGIILENSVSNFFDPVQHTWSFGHSLVMLGMIKSLNTMMMPLYKGMSDIQKNNAIAMENKIKLEYKKKNILEKRLRAGEDIDSNEIREIMINIANLKVEFLELQKNMLGSYNENFIDKEFVDKTKEMGYSKYRTMDKIAAERIAKAEGELAKLDKKELKSDKDIKDIRTLNAIIRHRENMGNKYHESLNLKTIQIEPKAITQISSVPGPDIGEKNIGKKPPLSTENKEMNKAKSSNVVVETIKSVGSKIQYYSNIAALLLTLNLGCDNIDISNKTLDEMKIEVDSVLSKANQKPDTLTFFDLATKEELLARKYGEIKNTKDEIVSLYNAGYDYNSAGKTEMAIKVLVEAESKAEKSGDIYTQIKINNLLGQLHEGNYQMSLGYFTKSFTLTSFLLKSNTLSEQDKMDLIYRLFFALNGVGDSYMNMQEDFKAGQYFAKSLKFKEYYLSLLELGNKEVNYEEVLGILNNTINIDDNLFHDVFVENLKKEIASMAEDYRSDIIEITTTGVVNLNNILKLKFKDIESNVTLPLKEKEKSINELIKRYKDLVDINGSVNEDGEVASNMEIYNNIGDCYMVLSDYKNAKIYYEKSYNGKYNSGATSESKILNDKNHAVSQLIIISYQLGENTLKQYWKSEKIKVEADQKKLTEDIQKKNIKIQIDNQELEQQKEIDRQTRNYLIGIVAVALAGLLGAGGLGFKLKKRNKRLNEAQKELELGKENTEEANKLLAERNEELTTTKEQLELNNKELVDAKETLQSLLIDLEHKNKEIESSIRYAKGLQKSIEPSPEIMALLGDHFVISMPKDIVSGDFYWMTRSGKKYVLATMDCTGHGVPGAFTSLLFYNLLKAGADKAPRLISDFVKKLSDIAAREDATMAEITSLIQSFSSDVDFDNVSPREIMEYAQTHIYKGDKNSGKEGDIDKPKDSADGEIVKFDPETMVLEYAGIGNDLLVAVKDREKFKSDNYLDEHNDHLKGKDQKKIEFIVDDQGRHLISLKSNMIVGPFGLTEYSIKLSEGDIYYTFSDGYSDQFGGKPGDNPLAQGKKFMKKKFKNLLLSISDEPMQKQYEILLKNFNDRKGRLEQTDDVTVLGVKLDREVGQSKDFFGMYTDFSTLYANGRIPEESAVYKILDYISDSEIDMTKYENRKNTLSEISHDVDKVIVLDKAVELHKKFKTIENFNKEDFNDYDISNYNDEDGREILDRLKKVTSQEKVSTDDIDAILFEISLTERLYNFFKLKFVKK